MALTTEERNYLWDFLINRFNLEELKNLAFFIGVDYELFELNNKQSFSRDFILHLERKNQLYDLITKIREIFWEDGLDRLLSKLLPSQPHIKIVVIDSREMSQIENIEKYRGDLAQVFGVQGNEVNIIAVASGNSVHMLVRTPKRINFQTILENRRLIGNQYQISSMYSFDSLNLTTQNMWRFIAIKWPPKLEGDTLIPAISWNSVVESFPEYHQKKVNESGENNFETSHGETNEEIPPPFSFLDHDRDESM